MPTPEYVFPAQHTWRKKPTLLLWRNWTATCSATNREDSLLIGPGNGMSFFSKDFIEMSYPGFCSAFKMLEEKGCDKYFATHVLKYSIEHASNETLDDFLVRSKTIFAVDVAFTLDLSGEEFVEMLANNTRVVNSSHLPDDLDHTAKV